MKHLKRFNEELNPSTYRSGIDQDRIASDIRKIPASHLLIR